MFSKKRQPFKTQLSERKTLENCLCHLTFFYFSTASQASRFREKMLIVVKIFTTNFTFDMIF